MYRRILTSTYRKPGFAVHSTDWSRILSTTFKSVGAILALGIKPCTSSASAFRVPFVTPCPGDRYESCAFSTEKAKKMIQIVKVDFGSEIHMESI